MINRYDVVLADTVTMQGMSELYSDLGSEYDIATLFIDWQHLSEKARSTPLDKRDTLIFNDVQLPCWPIYLKAENVVIVYENDEVVLKRDGEILTPAIIQPRSQPDYEN